MTKLLLRAIHGLHLYGLAAPNSETLNYEIWDRLPGDAKTRCKGNTFQICEKEFIRRLNLGGQDEVEVLSADTDKILYSRIAEILPILRQRVLSQGSGARRFLRDSYKNRIKSLISSEHAEHRRQAARLLHDLDRLINEGWFETEAFSRTPFAKLELYQFGLPRLPERWKENMLC